MFAPSEENVSAAEAKISKRQAAAACWLLRGRLFHKYTIDSDWESKSQNCAKNCLRPGCWEANLVKEHDCLLAQYLDFILFF